MKVAMEYHDEREYNNFFIVGHPLQYADFSEEDHFTSANATAHDLIEHINGWQNIGTVEDELQALGAAWWTRGQFHNTVTPEGLRGDVANNLQYITGRRLAPAIVSKTREYDLEDICNGELKRMCLAELSYGCNSLQSHIDNMIHNSHQVLGWMQLGYNKAKLRYGTDDITRGHYLFHNIEELLSRFSPSGEWIQKFDLHYTIRTAKAWIVEAPEPYYDY